MSNQAVTPEAAEALGAKLHEAIAANDHDTLRNEVYAPDVRVWHNNDRRSQDIDTNLKVLGWLHRNVADKVYDEVRRQPTPNGFVEQHVLRGKSKSGETIDVPACLVVTITDGRISLIEEYLDSSHIAALMG
jgi:ketosteroid isomerase-like protein